MTGRISLVLAGALAAVAVTAQAHHSWSVEYNTNDSIVVSGTVAEFLHRRPHSALTIDVQQPEGETVQWTVEWGGGFRDSEGNDYDPAFFEPGEAITVTGQPHRDEASRFVRMRTVLREADGKTFESSRRGRRGRNGRRGR